MSDEFVFEEYEFEEAGFSRIDEKEEDTSSHVVSVLVPVHNAAPYLSACIASVLAQDCLPGIRIELVIHDDASTDDGWQRLQAMMPQIRATPGVDVICTRGEQQRGCAGARNFAYIQSHGDFLCLLDADDVCAPNRISTQMRLLMQSVSGPDRTLVGARFRRLPADSTPRYTSWANNLTAVQLRTQIYTSHGPTLIAPTWFFSRRLFWTVGPFREQPPTGFPEDLDWFYRALDCGAQLTRTDGELVTYRYHPGCASLGVSADVIRAVRLARLEAHVLKHSKAFSIWNAGREGRRLYKSLSAESQAKLVNFADVDPRKLNAGRYEHFDAASRRVLRRVPIVHIDDCRSYIGMALQVKLPVIVCMKLDLTNGDFEQNLNAKQWTEGRDYHIFN